ncbi:MAG: toll/interleukin-1 receptor domain-containing protein [Chlorobiales bacterium]|nr:toll/interleukin-1 receptor domain-containing protein [Chlorobiales bacterium]
MGEQKMSRMIVFISHVWQDAKIALELKNWLETKFAGMVEVFASSDNKENLPIDGDWWNTIRQNMKDCVLFLPLLTTRAIGRNWIYLQAGGADVLGKKTIPLTLNTAIADWNPPLNQLEACDILQPKDIHALLQEIGKELNLSVDDDGVELARRLEEMDEQLNNPESSADGNSWWEEM